MFEQMIDLTKDEEAASESTITRALPEPDGWFSIKRRGVNDDEIARDAKIAKMARQEAAQRNKKTTAVATISLPTMKKKCEDIICLSSDTDDGNDVIVPRSTSCRKKMKTNAIEAKPRSRTSLATITNTCSSNRSNASAPASNSTDFSFAGTTDLEWFYQDYYDRVT